MNNLKILEFDIILAKLADNALSETAKARCLLLEPSLREAEVKRWMDETSQARQIIEQTGTPPLSSMTELTKIIDLINIEAMLMPEQIEHVLTFLLSCRKMKEYLRRAESTGLNIACYGGSIVELQELENEIKRCIASGTVADKASPQLDGIRRQIVVSGDQIKEKLDELLRKNKAWFSETFVSVRNGHYTLPVKREYRSNVSGSVIEMSNKGGTCFIEPASVGKLQTKLDELQIEEDSEVRRILFSLTASISENLRAIRLNMEAMETLDFLFAKGKLSLSMKASPVDISTDRKITIKNARHPLLSRETAVPLNFEIGKAGESCALYIAERLGMPVRILNRAHTAAYGIETGGYHSSNAAAEDEKFAAPPRIVKQKIADLALKDSGIAFNIGDSVFVYPQKEIGLVYARANEKGEVGVQVKGEKRLINHKRLKLNVPASELYPEDYDFSIVFDTVENRKARRIMGKRHQEGNVIIINEGEN